MTYRPMLALLALVVSFQGYAAQNVGGGSAVVCRDNSNAITYAELVDIYEGINRFGMTIGTDHTSPTELQVQKAIAKSGPPERAIYVAQTYASVFARRSFLPPGIALQLSNDLGQDYAVYVKEGCRLELIGYYEIDGKLRIVKNIYDHLSPSSQAGFWLHETFYRLTREFAGATDSEWARYLVATALATSCDEDCARSALDKVLIEHNAFLALRHADHLAMLEVTTSASDCGSLSILSESYPWWWKVSEQSDHKVRLAKEKIETLKVSPANCGFRVNIKYDEKPMIDRYFDAATLKIPFFYHIGWEADDGTIRYPEIK